MPKKREIQPVFKRVLALFPTYSDLARAADTAPQTVDYWLSIGYVPASACMKVSNATAAKVPFLELAAEAARMSQKRRDLRTARREIEARFNAAGENHGG